MPRLVASGKSPERAELLVLTRRRAAEKRASDTGVVSVGQPAVLASRKPATCSLQENAETSSL